MFRPLTAALLCATALTLIAAPALASDHAECQTVRFSDVGWTDITATTAATAVVLEGCLLYTSPSPRDLSTSRMPSSA